MPAKIHVYIDIKSHSSKFILYCKQKIRCKDRTKLPSSIGNAEVDWRKVKKSVENTELGATAGDLNEDSMLLCRASSNAALCIDWLLPIRLDADTT